MDNLQERLIEAQEKAEAAAEQKKQQQQEQLMQEFQQFLQMKAEAAQNGSGDTETPPEEEKGLFGRIWGFIWAILKSPKKLFLYGMIFVVLKFLFVILWMGFMNIYSRLSPPETTPPAEQRVEVKKESKVDAIEAQIELTDVEKVDLLIKNETDPQQLEELLKLRKEAVKAQNKDKE